MPSAPFARSCHRLVALAGLARTVRFMLRAPRPAAATPAAGGRALGEMLMMPRFMLSVAAGVVSYGLMTFMMTAAPMAMVGGGHSVDDAALGIQWHVLAMFAPSYVTSKLTTRFGKERIKKKVSRRVCKEGFRKV